MLKIQNEHVDWQHRWIRILKENSKTEVARVIPFERGSRLEEVLRRRAFLGPEAYVFGHAKTGEYVGSFRSAWETLLLLSHGVEPAALTRQAATGTHAFRKINLTGTTCDTRHCRASLTGVPVHEAAPGRSANITTTQRYERSRELLAESMRQARERRVDRLARHDEEQVEAG
jgi:hypothetical protein